MSAHRLRIRYARAARSDIVGILDYTEREWGEDQRSAYWRQLRSTIGTLTETPFLGRTRDDLLPGMRSYPAGSHLLYYLEAGNELVVVRILHSRQDPSREGWSLNQEPAEGADEPT